MIEKSLRAIFLWRMIALVVQLNCCVNRLLAVEIANFQGVFNECGRRLR